MCPSCGKRINRIAGQLPTKCPFCKAPTDGIEDTPRTCGAQRARARGARSTQGTRRPAGAVGPRTQRGRRRTCGQLNQRPRRRRRFVGRRHALAGTARQATGGRAHRPARPAGSPDPPTQAHPANLPARHRRLDTVFRRRTRRTRQFQAFPPAGRAGVFTPPPVRRRPHSRQARRIGSSDERKREERLCQRRSSIVETASSSAAPALGRPRATIRRVRHVPDREGRQGGGRGGRRGPSHHTGTPVRALPDASGIHVQREAPCCTP